MNIQRIIGSLSETQKGCIKYADYNRAGNNYCVQVERGFIRLQTIKSLIKKGLLHDGAYRYFLTDIGHAVHKELNAV